MKIYTILQRYMSPDKLAKNLSNTRFETVSLEGEKREKKKVNRMSTHPFYFSCRFYPIMAGDEPETLNFHICISDRGPSSESILRTLGYLSIIYTSLSSTTVTLRYVVQDYVISDRLTDLSM